MSDPVVWLRRVGAGVTIVVGWLFIFWVNNFHLTAPVVFACLGFFALVTIIVNLWRTGAAVAAVDEVDDESWGRPIGARGELEKEKRALLKAIKEAEFDREMGKLSPADASAMIGTYRARAIEVLKEVERLEAGEAGSVRERIEREIQARLAVDAEAARVVGRKKDKAAVKAETKPKPEPKAETQPEPQPEPQPQPEPVTAEDEAKEAMP